jgi:AraC-like DNA-binding protein
MNAMFNYNQLPSILNHHGEINGNGCFEKKSHFEIHTFEWMETQSKSWNNDQKDKAKQFELLWIKKGEGILHVENYQYRFSDNTIYCIAPGHHRNFIAHTNVDGYYISFAPEFIKLSQGYLNNHQWLEQYDNYFNITAIPVDKEMQYELEEIANKMKREYTNYFNRRIDLLKGLLNIFMIYFSRNLKENVPGNLPTREGELVRKFMVLLKKNFITQKMVSEYANHLCVTPNYLNRTVKKATGFTASYHIQQQIVIEAKRRAIHSSVSMKEIAYSLGFDNLAHFSKFFKSNSGVNFTDYKKGIGRPD